MTKNKNHRIAHILDDEVFMEQLLNGDFDIPYVNDFIAMCIDGDEMSMKLLESVYERNS